MTDSLKKFNRYMEMSSNIHEKMWDIWMMSMSNLNRSQEQMADFYKNYLDRVQQTSSEKTKMTDEMLKQLKDNQAQMRGLFDEAVKSALSNNQIPGRDYFAELNKKMSDLWKKEAK